MRIGIGYDVHKLVKDRALILGGVEIEHSHGLLGHSDADVLVHAVMDALLGAAGLGDIGRHFPDTDAQYKNISSMTLLTHVKDVIEAAGYEVSNIDSVVICEQPKLKDHIPEMVLKIAEVLEIEISQVNVKATTTEKLGFSGRKEGIAAEAVALLVKK